MINPIDPQALEKAQEAIPTDTLLHIVISVFKTVADPTRAKILYALRKKILCVRDLAILIGISESATSHQLRYLKEKYLVKATRKGTSMYYTLSYRHLSALLKEAEYYADHIKENLPDHPYDQA